MLAWIISRVETKALTPGMLPKIEWAGKELAKEVAKELKKMLARSVEIDRAVLEGQTPHRLSEGIFRISGLRSGALAHLLRIGHLTPEDVQWDDIDGDPEGVKRLWPAAVTPVTPATPADRQLYAEGGFEPAARAEESMPEPAPTEPSRVEPVSPSAPADAKGGAVAAIPETVGAQPKERRRPARDPVLLVLRELWPPNGVPPDHVSNPEIIQAVGNALEARRQRVPDRKTILRAAGRDPS
jgi:hypothetical protein